MSSTATLFIYYATHFLAYAVPSVLLLACAIRFKVQRQWPLTALTTALVLLLVGLGVQWIESLRFLAYWLGVSAQLAAAAGGLGIIVADAKPQGTTRPDAEPVHPFHPDDGSGSTR